MAVVDINSIEVLKERVEASIVLERDSLANYCEILRHLTFLADEVNGHPEMAVQMLVELKAMLSDLLSAVDPSSTPPVELPCPGWLRPWWLVAIIAGSSVISTLATMVITGVIHIPIP